MDARRIARSAETRSPAMRETTHEVDARTRAHAYRDGRGESLQASGLARAVVPITGPTCAHRPRLNTIGRLKRPGMRE